MNKASLKRLNGEQIESKPHREGRNVVKGTNKRVVVVKSPDPKVFEEAIFIVREDFSAGEGKINVLREAEKVADEYLGYAVCSTRKFLQKLPPVVFAAAGAVLGGAALLLLRLLGI